MSNMDTFLHSERVARDGTQRRREAPLGELPDGAMVLLDDPGAAFLGWQGNLYRWSPGGYVEKRAAPAERVVVVLTPPSVTRVLAAGYRPIVHPSVDALVAGR